MSRNLAFRLIVAAIGIPLLLAIAISGGILLVVLCVILAGGCGLEIARLATGPKINFAKFWGGMSAALMPIVFYFDLPIAAFFAAVVIGSGIIIAIQGKTEALADILLGLILPVIYPGLLLSYLVLLSKRGEAGAHLIVFTFLVVWAVDTAAYFWGSAFGRKKLSPIISPNKTWAGFYAGFAGAIVAAVVSGLIFLDMPWPKLITLSLMAALAAQIGDLFESALKRAYGAKDSSAFLPGHGGLLDRFDSLLFAAPVVYYGTMIMG